MEKTYYSETTGCKKEIDWNEFLKTPFKEMNSVLIEQYSNLASDWVTCAVGNQCSVIPRYDNGRPEDDILQDLGVEFYKKILDIEMSYNEGNKESFNNSKKSAKQILKQIEKRSVELIKEIMKETKKAIKEITT